jgi:ABC-type transport system involved in multi-copper enzyme maturation permease subunit
MNEVIVPRQHAHYPTNIPARKLPEDRLRGSRFISGLAQKLRGGWLGPHFYYDLIRLARKGWPTLARVLFLVIVLVSLLVMDRTQGESVRFTQPAEFAIRARNIAYLLIMLQYLLVLALLPVYVASSIVQEKENQTLESLTLTHLTDRELVLGKLGARLIHVGAFALASFPLLAFMNLWGNVDAAVLVYHEINLFLILLSAGSFCIWISTKSESAFQAISSSYAWLALLGFLSIFMAFVLPWIWNPLLRFLGHLLEFAARPIGRARPVRDGEPSYWISLAVLALAHCLVAFAALYQAIARMEILRREERRRPRKITGALTLTDKRPISTRTGKRGQTKSRIHPRAWPVRGHALWWKECIKDGTDFSLSIRWLYAGLAVVAGLSIVFQLLHLAIPAPAGAPGVRTLAYTLTFTTYFVSLTAYTLVVLFQMTMSVAGEREQGTLTFLLTISDERRTILFAKWLGPWWRNWPILAICYLGVLLGFGSGLYDWKGTLFLLAAPWPFLLMLGGLALWLSVVCRRVLFANIALVGFLGILLLTHIAAGKSTLIVLAYYLVLLGAQAELALLGGDTLSALTITLAQQGIFLTLAAACTAHSFWVFGKKDYSTS